MRNASTLSLYNDVTDVSINLANDYLLYMLTLMKVRNIKCDSFAQFLYI